MPDYKDEDMMSKSMNGKDDLFPPSRFDELMVAFTELDDEQSGFCDMDTMMYILRNFRSGLKEWELPVVRSLLKAYVDDQDRVVYLDICPLLTQLLNKRLWEGGSYLATPDRPPKKPETDKKTPKEPSSHIKDSAQTSKKKAIL
ncbi:uncharacterized protein LOC115221749 [Argonauta hians]